MLRANYQQLSMTTVRKRVKFLLEDRGSSQKAFTPEQSWSYHV